MSTADSPPPSHSSAPASTLREMEIRGTTATEVLAFYDSLPPVTIDQMLGTWRGSGVNTGNPLDGLLELTGWQGKRYETSEDAHPLIMAGDRGRYSLNPALVPMNLVIRLKPLLQRMGLGRLIRVFLPLLKTRRPAARLRMVEYRGVLSGTMIYDALPSNDHFRLVDPDTLLGAMDFRGLPAPFIFVLRREESTAE